MNEQSVLPQEVTKECHKLHSYNDQIFGRRIHVAQVGTGIFDTHCHCCMIPEIKPFLFENPSRELVRLYTWAPKFIACLVSGTSLGDSGGPEVSYAGNIQFVFHVIRLLLIAFIGSVCRQRQCVNFSVSRVNFLTTLHSHLNVSCYFWSSLFNVDVNYSYILSLYCSGYLKCIEKDLVSYTYFDSC